MRSTRSRSRLLAAVLLAATPSCGDTKEKLIPSLEHLAERGNAEAIYHLGMAYHTGSGIIQDHAKALEAFRRAAAMGDPLAAYKLGCYYDGQGEGLVQPDAALALKEKLVAARAGYALAQQDVGSLYARSGDVNSGLAWLEKSAAQGWSGGLMTLSSVYNGAPGVTPDPAKTAAYFQLFLAQTEPTQDQLDRLQTYRRKLSAADLQRADEIVRTFRPSPTALTIKALSGRRAAVELVEASSRN